jgi:hypothetical protein
MQVRWRGPVSARIRQWIWVAALVIALVPTPSSARYMTGLALLDWCKDDGSTFCPGYLAALADYQSVLQALDTETPRFCLPSNVKLAALRSVVLEQLGAEQPDALAGVAADLMIPALARRFPELGADRGCAERAASYVTGYELIDWCQDEASRFCAGYIAALVDYQDGLQRLDTPTPRFCLGTDTKLSELEELALRGLRANPPSELRKLAASLVVPAFFRKYPCR